MLSPLARETTYRSCAPWLVQRGADGQWRLDLVTMQRALRFDTRNHWQVADRLETDDSL